jgi:small-conductance mechanosensitive channel
MIASLVLALVAAVGSAAIGAQTQSSPGADDEVVTVPVEIDGVTLFTVRGVSSYTADDRAGLIEGRIVAAARNPSVTPDSLHLAEGPGVMRLAAGDEILMSVADADAALEGVSRRDLATAHLMRVRAAIIEYREARSTPAVARSAVRTGAASVVLVVALVVLFRFWRWFDGVVRQRLQARIHTVGIQSFEVVRAEQIHAALQTLLFAVRVTLAGALVLAFVGYVLALWPSTRGLSRSIAGLMFDPLRTLAAGFAANIPRLAFLVVLFMIVRVGLRLIRLFFEAVAGGAVALSGFDREWAQPTYKIVRIGVVALGLIVAYPYIPGSQSEAFKGISLFIGIVFSLGSSSAISNVIAGYMMTYRRAFRAGDRVKIGDAIGDVIELRLQVTHLRTVKNEEVVIPNSQILSGEVLNYSSLARTRGLILHTEVGIGYDTPWRQVEAMLLAAAARTAGLGSQPAPFVLVKDLGEFAVTYEVNVPCGEVQTMAAQYTALHHSILDVFNEHGVQIMVPSYEGDPPEPKVVAPADWIKAPAVSEAAGGR